MSRSKSSRSRAKVSAHAEHPVAHKVTRMTGAASGRARGGGRGNSRRSIARSRHIEQDRTASLRGAGRGASADRLEIDYSSGAVSLQLVAAGIPVLQGLWETTVRHADGRLRTAAGVWEFACWQSDDDGDYLELQLWLTETLRLDRMLFLSRTGRFALLGDALIALQDLAPAAAIEYVANLPRAGGVSAIASRDDNLVKLQAARATVRCFPLALPIPAAGRGSLTAPQSNLQLVQQITGGSVWVPLLLDWNPARIRKPVVIRKLTVSEARQVVADHQASASRWQCGTEHLLIYRGLTPPQMARAVLGMHTWFETAIVRLKKPGEYEPLVQIEPAGDSQ